MRNHIIPFTIREGDIMCTILKNLKNKTAEELLKIYDIQQIPPINISLLLNKIGIKKIPFDFSEIENLCKCDKGSILGIIFAKDESLNIFYRMDDTLNRQRFTLAHELAHCCLDTDSLKKRHIELRDAETSNEPKERRANTFAGELLIPQKSLESIYPRLIMTPTLTDLANIYKVSRNVMAARLDYLEMPYIKK